MTRANTAFVYIAQDTRDHFKVGVARDPQSRLDAIQAPYPLSLYRTFGPMARQGAEYFERQLHHALREHHTNGEWFTCPEKVIDRAVKASGIADFRIRHIPRDRIEKPIGRPRQSFGNLTKLQVARLQTPGHHSDGRGLYLQVTRGKRGIAKSWVFRFTRAGHTREMGLGSLTGTNDLNAARAARDKCAALLRDGKDPIDQRNLEKTNAPHAEIHTGDEPQDGASS